MNRRPPRTGFEQKITKVRKEFLISAEPDFEQEVTEVTETDGLVRTGNGVEQDV